MALINLIPGMGGQVGSLVTDSISLLEDLATCGPENPFSCFAAVVDLAMVLFDAFQAFFPSRPKVGKDSASDDTALFFIPSTNPTIALWGIGIRDLETQGIPTSASGGSGYTAQLNLANAVLADLKAQFDPPGAPKLTLQGVAATGTQVFAWYHKLGFEVNHPDSNATAIQERIKVDNLYHQLVVQKWIDPLTGFPFKVPPPPPNPCPAGQHWDAALGKCVPDAPPPPPPGDPDQDELQDCCDETQAALANLYGAIASLGAGGNEQLCCANIVAAISALTAQVTAVAKVISTPQQPAPPIDLTPIVNELAALVAAVAAAGKVDLSGIVTELTRIADLLGTATHIAVKRPPYSPFVQKFIDQALAIKKDAADQLATVRPDLAQIMTS
jgi:hypothetical protein